MKLIKLITTYFYSKKINVDVVIYHFAVVKETKKLYVLMLQYFTT